MTVDRAFDSPEAAALAGWPPSAHVRIVDVTISNDRAEVVVDTDPSYPYWCYSLRRADGLWRRTVDGNGPCLGWDDPTFIQWSS